MKLQLASEFSRVPMESVRAVTGATEYGTGQTGVLVAPVPRENMSLLDRPIPCRHASYGISGDHSHSGCTALTKPRLQADNWTGKTRQAQPVAWQ